MATRPVAQTIFATLTGPINEPVSVLDANITASNAAIDDPLIASNLAVDTGAVNAYSATISPGITVLDTSQQGLRIEFFPSSTNTGPSTFTLNGFGPVAITWDGNRPLLPGMIKAGTVSVLIWTGSGWQLMGAQVNGSTFSIASLNTYNWN